METIYNHELLLHRLGRIVPNRETVKHQQKIINDYLAKYRYLYT